MPRWKTSEQILNLNKDGEVFDENWMNYDSIYQYMPEPIKWKEDRKIRFEDVDIWEVITEISGPIGVYAAWQPYAPYFIIMRFWKLDGEFWGASGEKLLKKEMEYHGVYLSTNEIWVDEEDMWQYHDKKNNGIIIP